MGPHDNPSCLFNVQLGCLLAFARSTNVDMTIICDLIAQKQIASLPATFYKLKCGHSGITISSYRLGETEAPAWYCCCCCSGISNSSSNGGGDGGGSSNAPVAAEQHYRRYTTIDNIKQSCNISGYKSASCFRTCFIIMLSPCHTNERPVRLRPACPCTPPALCSDSASSCSAHASLYSPMMLLLPPQNSNRSGACLPAIQLARQPVSYQAGRWQAAKAAVRTCQPHYMSLSGS